MAKYHVPIFELLIVHKPTKVTYIQSNEIWLIFWQTNGRNEIVFGNKLNISIEFVEYN